MAWDQAAVDTLKSAIASGVLSVHFDGPPSRSVTYQSIEQMLQALSLMQKEVQGDSAVTYRLAATSKGV